MDKAPFLKARNFAEAGLAERLVVFSCPIVAILVILLTGWLTGVL
jgi:hypothetical protein